jgi:hypothetical protein
MIVFSFSFLFLFNYDEGVFIQTDGSLILDYNTFHHIENQVIAV